MFFFTLGCNVMISWGLDVLYTAASVCVCARILSGALLRAPKQQMRAFGQMITITVGKAQWVPQQPLLCSNQLLLFSLSSSRKPLFNFFITHSYIFLTSSDQNQSRAWKDRKRERFIVQSCQENRQEGSVRHAKGATGKWTIRNSTSLIVNKIQHSFVCSINS